MMNLCLTYFITMFKIINIEYWLMYRISEFFYSLISVSVSAPKILYWLGPKLNQLLTIITPMVMPTPPMMCSLESNTSSIASGQLCNTQAWFLSASSQPMSAHDLWYCTQNTQPESIKAPVNHCCHSNTASRELLCKGKTDKLVTHISPSLCGWHTVIAKALTELKHVWHC